jgi:hypothetical protein
MTTTGGQGKHHRIHDVRLPSTTREPELPLWNSSTDPLAMAPHWALCPLDWQAHAIDAWADHPLGVWVARCGDQLSGGTPLYDVPQEPECPSCARWSTTSEPRTRTGQ